MYYNASEISPLFFDFQNQSKNCLHVVSQSFIFFIVCLFLPDVQVYCDEIQQYIILNMDCTLICIKIVSEGGQVGLQ